MEAIECASHVRHVMVYARGAVVTRRVETPALPEAATLLAIAGLPALADPGSLRVLSPGRPVVALRSELVIPAGPGGPGPAIAEVRRLYQELQALRAEETKLTDRAQKLAAAPVKLWLDPRDRRTDPAQRAADSLGATRILAELARTTHERVRELAARIAEVERRLAAAQLEAEQATSHERAGDDHPTRRVLVTLAAGPAQPAFELSYAVPAARWWPAYVARVAEDRGQVELAMSAFVAQASGENWTGVELSLSTADLVRDARLPELPSLRLGRAQAPVKRGYRPPPPGLDAMFVAYDRARADMPPPPAAAPSATAAAALAEADGSPAARAEKSRARRVETLAGGAPGGPPPPAPPPAPRPASLAMPVGAAVPMAPAAPAPMAAPMMPPPMAARAAAPPMAEQAAAFRGSGGPPAPQAKALPVRDEPPAAIEPADAWLDFDTLELAGGDAGRERGRLRRAPARAAGHEAQAAAARIEGAQAPPHAVDPRDGRGHFDHRWDASARADVPSDARPHRLPVASATAAARPRFLCVPREATEVYGELELTNPFAAPLLAGPVDVFVGGALLTTVPLAAVDRGGGLRLALGVEDRLRVARNARVQESTAGLLGGSTLVTHEVTIDVRSSLGRPVALRVLERVPVTDSDDVEVSHTARPPAEAYDQAERGAPVRGGLRWEITVPPGGQTSVVLEYKLKLPGKNEIVGGNRRE